MRPISERQSAPVGDILPPKDARRNLFADNKQRSVCPSVRRTSSLTYCRPQLSSLGLVMRSTCLCPPVSQPSLYPMESRPFTPYLSGHLSCEQADGPEQTGMGSGILVLGGSRAGGDTFARREFRRESNPNDCKDGRSCSGGRAAGCDASFCQITLATCYYCYAA